MRVAKIRQPFRLAIIIARIDCNNCTTCSLKNQDVRLTGRAELIPDREIYRKNINESRFSLQSCCVSRDCYSEESFNFKFKPRSSRYS